jgi:hypothetical protein
MNTITQVYVDGRKLGCNAKDNIDDKGRLLVTDLKVELDMGDYVRYITITHGGIIADDWDNDGDELLGTWAITHDELETV